MINFLRRFWPRRRAGVSITSWVYRVMVPKPIPLSERKPGPEDCDGHGCCWCFDPEVWTHNVTTYDEDGFLTSHKEIEGPAWEFRPVESTDTHWLPASVELLPARCFPPEVG